MTVAVDQIPDVPNDMEFNHWHFLQKLKDAIKDVNIAAIAEAAGYVPPVGSKVSAYLAADQTGIAQATFTKVEFNAVKFDTLDEFDITTNHRFIAKSSGYYMVTGSVRWNSLDDGDYITIAIYVNGSSVSLVHTELGGGTTPRYNSNKLVYLEVDDYIELWTRHGYTGNRDIDSEQQGTYLTIHRVF